MQQLPQKKRVVVIASDGSIAFELPMLQGAQGIMYAFGTFMSGQMMTSFVQKIDESTSEWQFLITQIQAESVDYSNDALPNVTNVKSALDDTIDTLQTQSADTESLRAGVSALMNAYQTQGGDIASLKTQAHTHSNKAVLDKFSEADGKPTYNGEALGGGAGDFIIKMTVERNDVYFTVTSCDATIEQIDAAVAAEKRVAVIATDTAGGVFWELPIVEAYHGATYIFIAYTYGRRMMATVYKSGENEIWEFAEGGISAESIDYFNSTQPDVESVHAALNKLFTNSHTHANKDTLDKLSVSNGKLQYNGSDVGAKEQLTGTTSELTPTQVYDAVSAGIPVKVQYLHDVYGLLSFTAFNIAESFNIVVSQTIVYYNGAYILAELNGHKSENRWGTLFTTLAEKTDIPDIPMTLPNPHAITFTGAVTGNYDGSTPMTVNIPSAVTDEHINSLIDTKLGVIENGSY